MKQCEYDFRVIIGSLNEPMVMVSWVYSHFRHG